MRSNVSDAAIIHSLFAISLPTQFCLKKKQMSIITITTMPRCSSGWIRSECWPITVDCKCPSNAGSISIHHHHLLLYYSDGKLILILPSHKKWTAKTCIYIRNIKQCIFNYPFNGPFSGTTQVGRYQKGKTNLDLLKQETVSGSGISWAICKSAPRSRQIITPAPHYSVFFTGRMPFLPPNQQRQSTEGNSNYMQLVELHQNSTLSTWIS